MRLADCRFVYQLSRTASRSGIPFKRTTVIADNTPFSALRMKNITDYLEKEQVDQVLEAALQCSTRAYLILGVLWRACEEVTQEI